MNPEGTSNGLGLPTATIGGQARPAVRFAVFAVVLMIAFCRPLYDLVRHAALTDTYSHIPLIPCISAYLIWQRRELWRTIPGRFSLWGVLPALAGLALLAAWIGLRHRGWRPALEDNLSLTISSFYCLLLAGGFFFLGGRMLRAVAFPVAFLVFIVPFPVVFLDGLETFFQYTSADAASGFMTIFGVPFIRNGLEFQLPGIAIRVAQECSGVRSSLVLFIVSLLAGNLFLRRTWTRVFFTVFVIPLGILRNGFRVATIAALCVHVDVGMIDSPIHHHGGPLFFALSLIPFFLVLMLLRRLESSQGDPKGSAE